MKRPICHESRDLGYAREYNARQRKITFVLLVILAIGICALWRVMP